MQSSNLRIDKDLGSFGILIKPAAGTQPMMVLMELLIGFSQRRAGTREDALNAAVRPSIDAICDAIASAAASNNLPIAFFTRLIWQESRFDPWLVSSKGARGIAQFMPATASWRGLNNPFDPIAAIPKAAQFLDELRGSYARWKLQTQMLIDFAACSRAHDHRLGQRQRINKNNGGEYRGDPKDLEHGPHSPIKCFCFQHFKLAIVHNGHFPSLSDSVICISLVAARLACGT
jgi:Transglycosylase SLT domain